MDADYDQRWVIIACRFTPVFCFYKVGKRWVIGEKGNTREFEHLDGFHCIHYLLSRKYEHLLPSVIYNSGKISGDDEISVRERVDLNLHPEAPLQIKRRAKGEKEVTELQIELEIDRLQDQIDSDESLTAEDKMIKGEEIDELKKYLGQKFSKRPERDSKSQSEKARRNVTKLIKKALSEIHNDKIISSIAGYLNKGTIRTGDTCVYYPVEDNKPAWILDPP